MATSTGKIFNISGLAVEQIETEPCYRVSQFMKGEEITCSCSQCLIDNKGLTSEQIKKRMEKSYPGLF